MNRFVLTSTLKAKAQREAKKNIAEWSKSQRMVNQFTGASTLKKNHFRDAERKFKASSGISDLRKAEYLISALYDIYISYFMMKNNRFTDTKVSELLKRIKTSYFNTVLNYIEQNIYQPGYSEKIYLELKQALQVLSEENRQLANGYKKILVQYNNRESFLVKTENILQIPPIEFTSSFSDKIAALWRRNESVLKKNNSFMKEVQDKISDKMNLIFEYFWDELQEELNKTSPHLEKAVASAEKILNIHKPLKLIVNCKYYTRLKEMTDKYADYKKFLDIKYPEFLKLYQYLQIPKNKEPLKQIYDAFTELEETKELWANNFYEFSRLDPGPGIIFKFLDDKLYNTHKSEIISYYKHYNKILSEPDIALKLKEMIRYSEHLQNKMIKVLQNPFLASKLKELIGSITEDVRKTVYTYLEDKLKYSNSYEEKIGFYDEAVASFIALKSLDDVENVQKQKQKFIHNELSFAPENINEDFEDETETIKIENIPTKLIILDNYTLKNYIIFSGYQIEMGRSEDNDIILQCPWISQKHAKLDFEKNLITDTKSTNGTVFNNGIKRKKDKENISDLKSFCLADVFKFEVSRFMNSISFKLVEIMNKQYENKPENKDYLTSLKNTSFVYLAENDTMTLNKKNAKLNESDKIQEEIIEIKRINNAFYVSDFAKGLKEIHPEHIFSERFTFKAD